MWFLKRALGFEMQIGIGCEMFLRLTSSWVASGFCQVQSKLLISCLEGQGT